MADWYYMFNGQQNGPVSGSQLKSLAATGGLGPDDLVWNESMTDWVAAQRVKGLTFARAAQAAAPRRPMAAPAPTYAPQPAAAPPVQEDVYDTLPEAAYAAPVPVEQLQQSQSLAYSQPNTEIVSPKTIALLRQTRPWVMVISILMFIGVGMLVLFGVGVLLMCLIGGATLSSAASASARPGSASAAGAGFAVVAGLGLVFATVLMIYGTLLFFPALYLMKYATAINKLVSSRQASDLDAALGAQKSYWKFIGIVALVGIGLNAMMFVFGAGGRDALRTHRPTRSSTFHFTGLPNDRIQRYTTVQ